MSILSRRWLLPPSLLLACSGCLFTHHATNVVGQDEPRREVRFESSAAEQTFATKAFDDKARTAASRSKVVAIPFLLWSSKVDVLSENAYYNDQVAACDVNGDGLITLQEATDYRPASTFQQLTAFAASRSDRPAVSSSSPPDAPPKTPTRVVPISLPPHSEGSGSAPPAPDAPTPESLLHADLTQARRNS